MAEQDRVHLPCGHSIKGGEVDDICEQIVLNRGFTEAMASIEGAAVRLGKSHEIHEYWQKMLKELK